LSWGRRGLSKGQMVSSETWPDTTTNMVQG
jgi:hypothetical protein